MKPKVDKDKGGWLVRSSDWRKGPFYYHVYRTVHGVWLCTCDDYVIYGHQICKHIIRVFLFLKFPEDETDRLDRVLKSVQEGIYKEKLH